MNPIIRVEELHKNFGEVEAVNGVTFEVNEGEIFGFLGPNGVGKTTTVRMITGVLKPDYGKSWINGKNVIEQTIEAKQSIGIAPEVSNAYVDLTGWQNLMFMGELYGVPREKRERRGSELLKTFDLLDRRDSKVKGYSKGMQRRLILAMAMIHKPEILFLDEPTSGLDVQSKRLIKNRIREINDEGKTVFLTTHNIPEASELCDRVAVINHGRIAAIDTPQKLTGTIKKTQSVEIAFNETVKKSELLESFELERIEERGNEFRIYTKEPVPLIDRLIEFAKKENLKILSIKTVGPSLEDAFVKLTEGEKK